jgi:hypothetical protein
VLAESICEGTITELLEALVEMRGALAMHYRTILQLTSGTDPVRSLDETVYDVEFHRSDSELPAISGYFEVKINGVSNVWWIQIYRASESGWRVRRFVEIYPVDGDEYVARELDETSFADSKQLAAGLVTSTDELLAVSPPSLTD